MKNTFCLLIFVLGFSTLSGQVYTDYLGAGHISGVEITSSGSNAQNSPYKSFDGSGLHAKLFDASRFLTQATMGPSLEMSLALEESQDYNGWIDAQFVTSYDSITPLWDSIYYAVLDMRIAGGEAEEDLPNQNHRFFTYAWTQANMTTDALLRHKVAHALSQQFVISFDSKLSGSNRVVGISNFYDMLLYHSFGNYRDLIEDVTFHPSMGYYLTHMNNSRSFPEDNIFPDENYAREIMQLFSIGLFMLNPDGTHQLDADGNSIPTYNNDDINELAKVFTGLGPGAVAPHITFTNVPYFGLSFTATSLTDPMIMYDFFHEIGEKTLPDGTVLSDTLTPLEDIDAVHDWLFNHQNTGPFFCRRLIQRLVSSNPSPEYIGRISAIFGDNGNGVRGDLKAVIKAILLDEEARSAEHQLSISSGRLKEPMMRAIGAARALPTDKLFDRYWDNGVRWLKFLRQRPMTAPTVFNFYLPDFVPVGDISAENLVGPEYQLHFTSSAIDYVNQAYNWGWSGNLQQSSENSFGDENVKVLFEELTPLSDSPDLLINHIDKLLTHGTMSDYTRGVIREAIKGININSKITRVRLALYLTLMSAEYAVIH